MIVQSPRTTAKKAEKHRYGGQNLVNLRESHDLLNMKELSFSHSSNDSAIASETDLVDHDQKIDQI